MARIGSHRAYERVRGMAHGSVRRAIQSGRIADALRPDGMLDFEAADRELERNTRSAAPANGNGHGPAASTYRRARAARQTFAAQLARIEYEVTTESLVRADDAREAARAHAARARRLIAEMRERMAPALAPAALAALDGELARVLDELEPQRGRA